eukprot:6534856-Lingulodinium_polyedra.AAC.1
MASAEFSLSGYAVVAPAASRPCSGAKFVLALKTSANDIVVSASSSAAPALGGANFWDAFFG